VTAARPRSLAPLALPLATLVAALVLLAGCGGGGGGSSSTAASTPATPSGGGGATGAVTPGVYVNQVKGTNASIALVTDGHRLSGAYLCIPQQTPQWIKPAPFANGKVPLVARRGVILGSAKFTPNGATGTIKAQGTDSFSAKLATGKAGLYRTTSGTSNQPGFSETGWIVLPDGSVCGGTNTITAGGGFQTGPAPSTTKGQITDFANPFPF
jgi:hypothetical protein